MRGLFQSAPRSRALSLAAIVVLAIALMGAGDSTHARFNQLGHGMMCTCGCSQILLECNHVGCQESDRLRRELSDALERGQSDEQIIAAFREKYGPVILAAPTKQGFDLVAWTMPGLVLLLGIVGATLVVYRWHLKRQPAPEPVPAASAPLDPYEDDLRRRARRETEL
jgi:cytochrome c-type biogenesis protein CcmH/NrfF